MLPLQFRIKTWEDWPLMPLFLGLLAFVIPLSIFPADMECRSMAMGLFGRPKRFSLGLSEKEMGLLLKRVKNHFGEDFMEQRPESLSDEQLRKLLNLTGGVLEERGSSRGLLARPTGMAREFFRQTLPQGIAQFFKDTSVFRYVFPHRTILNRGNIHIVGLRRTPRELAERVARVIDRFDEEAQGWGLRIPEFVKVFLIDKPFWPRGGSVSHYIPVASPSGTRAGMPIEFTPFWSRPKEDLSPAVIMHERTHNILRHNFKDDSFVNDNRHNHIISEALADFLSAHVRGSPDITMRNIESMESEGIGIQFIKQLAGLNDDFSDHAKSTIFSNLLWRLREKIGREGISDILLPFFGELNAYSKNLEGKNDVASLYTYFAATLLKVASERGFFAVAAQVVSESSERLSFDSREIFSLLKQLRPDTAWREKLPTVREAVAFKRATIGVMVLGTGLIGAAGAGMAGFIMTIYTIFGSLWP